MPTAMTRIIMPMLPMPWKLFHQALKAGAMLCPRTTTNSAEANPAAKLLIFGFSEGRYKKPEPEECGGMMNMSYFPGGRLPFELVVRGFSPCGGGGGGGGPLIVVEAAHSSRQESK